MIASAALAFLMLAGLNQIVFNGPPSGRSLQPMGEPGESPPVPVGKSVISGKVINSKTQEPVKKAHVFLNGPANLTAVTDSSGSFTFRALPPGGYVVSANQEEYYVGAGSMNMAQLTLAEDEEKQNVQVKLTPGAIINGRILDEDDVPVPGCQIAALFFDRSQGTPRMVPRNNATTDDEGIYRIHSLQQGRYVLRARCMTTFPAPHGFMKRNDPMAPHEGYVPAFASDGDPAAGMPVAAGADLSGVNFHVKRVPVFSVAGTISGVDQSVSSGATLLLVPQGGALPEENELTAGFDARRGQYLFSRVPAGSYLVTATAFNADRVFSAQQTVDVGKSPMAEFDLKLTAASALAGTVEVDDPAQRFENMQLSMQPLDYHSRGPAPVAAIGADGAFEFKSVLPGHFRLNPLPVGYIKAFSINGRDVSPQDFEVSGESSGPMRIVAGTKTASLEVTASEASSVGSPLSALLIAEDDSVPRNVAVASPQGGMVFGGIAPGKYRILVVASANAWNMTNQPELLHSLDSHSVEVEVAEGDDKKVSAPVLSADELQKAVDSAP